MGTTLYARLLGPRWQEAADPIRRVHGSAGGLRATGVFRVMHGERPAARFLARLLRLPAEAESTLVRLEVTSSAESEQWRRSFGGRWLVTMQAEGPGGVLAERIGLLELQFQLAIEGGSLVFLQKGAGLRLGRLFAPLPGWLRPTVTATEAPGNGPDSLSTLVNISLPRIGRLLSYSGTIDVAEDAR